MDHFLLMFIILMNICSKKLKGRALQIVAKPMYFHLTGTEWYINDMMHSEGFFLGIHLEKQTYRSHFLPW